MYVYITLCGEYMHRTQIYLDDEIVAYLDKEKQKTHLSYSEIIRKNLKENITWKNDSVLRKMEQAAGSWKGKSIDPVAYVNDIRKDREL